MKTSFLLLSLAAIAIAGCSKTVTWKEEVQLSDGRVIVVERETINVSGGGEWARGGPGYRPEKRMLRVEYPIGSGRYVEWLSTKQSADYQIPEKPLVLDMESNTLVVYSITATSNGCKEYSKYVYQSDKWYGEELPDEFPARPTNLLLRDAMEMSAYVSVEETRKNHQEVGYFQSLKWVGPKRVYCGR